MLASIHIVYQGLLSNLETIATIGAGCQGNASILCTNTHYLDCIFELCDFAIGFFDNANYQSKLRRLDEMVETS
jgi:hypothetical protein